MANFELSDHGGSIQLGVRDLPELQHPSGWRGLSQLLPRHPIVPDRFAKAHGSGGEVLMMRKQQRPACT